MNPTNTIGTAGIWGFDPIFKVFNTLNEGAKFLTTHIEFVDRTAQISGTIALLELAKVAEKKKWKGSADLAANHDKYFYEAWKAENQTEE